MNPNHVVPVDDVKSTKYICLLCKFVLQEPMQAPCAHFFCKGCLPGISVSKNFMKCPVDSSTFTKEEVFPDACVRIEVRRLLVHCTKFKSGCTWEGKFQELKNHLLSCAYIEVKCDHTDCNELVLRSDLQEHLQNQCTQRQVQCRYCKEEMVFCAEEDHQTRLCKSFPVECDSCKKQNIPRELLSQHESQECLETKKFCPFLGIGCEEKQEMKRQPRKKHEESMLLFHLNLLLYFAFGLKEEIGRVAADVNPLRDSASLWNKVRETVSHLVPQVASLSRDNSQIKALVQAFQSRLTTVEEKCDAASGATASSVNTNGLQAQLQQLVSVINDLIRKISNVEAKEENHELLLVEANGTIEKQRVENETLKRELSTSRDETRALGKRVDTLEQLVRKLATPLVLHPPSYDGILLWKITGVAEKRNDAIAGRQTSVYSPDFYTGRHGYRMCARIYLDGDGMGRGSHISVFFTIKRSEHDALLRWPFRQKVTIMLLDQDNEEHVIDSFRPDPNSSSFQKPRRESNIASGCPLFCPLSLLERRAFIREDTMFVKVVVDCLDL